MTPTDVQVKVEQATGYLCAVHVHQPDLATDHWHVTVSRGAHRTKLCLHATLLGSPDALRHVVTSHHERESGSTKMSD